MDLQALNSPLPKPWLNPQVNTLTAATIVSSDTQVDTLEVKDFLASDGTTSMVYDVYEQTHCIQNSNLLLQLTTAQFPSGVCRIQSPGGTGPIICPTSADIDNATRITTDGHLIWMDFINNFTVGTNNVMTDPSNNGINIPNAQAGPKNIVTRMWFTRIAGVWTCLN
jgi:hypothetical protein